MLILFKQTCYHKNYFKIVFSENFLGNNYQYINIINLNIKKLLKNFGYIRKWNYYNQDKNIIALGLEKHIFGSNINGILFDVHDNEIALLDKREIGY